jgi:hypothetical protein
MLDNGIFWECGNAIIHEYKNENEIKKCVSLKYRIVRRIETKPEKGGNIKFWMKYFNPIKISLSWL